MPLTAILSPRLLIALALAGLLAVSHLTAYRSGRASVQAKWDAANVTQEREAQKQATRNRELQRAAELRYVVQREAQDRFLVTTVREVHDAASSLADCRVPDSVGRLLRDAAACALGDPPASCGAADEVPKP
jgi:hypothetical protein